MQAEADSPGRSRQDQHFHAELLDHPNRKCDGFQVVTLVVVKPPLEHDHVLPSKFAAEHLPGVPGHPGYGKMGNSSVRNDPGARSTWAASRSTRSEHDRGRRRVAQ